MQPEPAIATGEVLHLEEALCRLIEDAHQEVCLEGERRAMSMDSLIASAFYPATTIVMVLFSKPVDVPQSYRMSYAHIGDSRIYLSRQGKQELQRLTDDDGFLALKLQEGLIDPEDVMRIDQATTYDELNDLEQYCFDNRNAITQALGSRKPLEIHVNTIDVQPGDRILLCSDGIHDNLTDKELAPLVQQSGRTTAAKKIVQRAVDCANSESLTNMRAKCDDMSAVVISCELLG
jgi:protein phosphatase